MKHRARTTVFLFGLFFSLSIISMDHSRFFQELNSPQVGKVVYLDKCNEPEASDESSDQSYFLYIPDNSFEEFPDIVFME